MNYATLEERGIIISTRDLVEKKVKLPNMTFFVKNQTNSTFTSAYLALFSKALNL